MMMDEYRAARLRSCGHCMSVVSVERSMANEFGSDVSIMFQL